MTEEEKKLKQREWEKQWRAKNKEHVKEYKRKWEAEHKDAVKASRQKYKRSHREDARRAWQNRYLDLEHWKWEDVEGYDGFTTNTDVHHKREAIGYTRQQLIEQGQYYGCRADELICVTHAEHARIHHDIDVFFGRPLSTNKRH